MSTDTTRIEVTGAHSYFIEIGETVFSDLAQYLRQQRPSKVLLVYAPPVTQWVSVIETALSKSESMIYRWEVPDGEAAKTSDVLTAGWDKAAEIGLDRADLLISVGGGAVTDLAGFLAATWLRGVGIIHLPTSLLGMVDAAVGGKTGINTAAGKNLAGAFYAPKRVYINPLVLQTLPAAEFRAGMAEILKCGFIKDPLILQLLEAADTDIWEFNRVDPILLQQLIVRAVQVKAAIVSADFREAGVREHLNYGHTLAHAIEKVSDYQVRHGEAVAIGMVYAVKLAHRLGYASESWVKLHLDLIHSLGLPSSWETHDYSGLFDAMLHDKKVRAGNLRFVFTTALERENLPGDTWVSEVPLRIVLEVLESK